MGCVFCRISSPPRPKTLVRGRPGWTRIHTASRRIDRTEFPCRIGFRTYRTTGMHPLLVSIVPPGRIWSPARSEGQCSGATFSEANGVGTKLLETGALEICRLRSESTANRRCRLTRLLKFGFLRRPRSPFFWFDLDDNVCFVCIRHRHQTKPNNILQVVAYGD